MNTYKTRWALRGVAALGLLACGAAALAQAPSSNTSEVKIEANKIVTVTQGQFPKSTEMVQLTRTVGYGDLDLANPAGAEALKLRVQVTAEQVCDQLRSFAAPGSGPSEMSERAACVKGAVDAAMNKVKMAIASAQKGKQR